MYSADISLVDLL